MELEELRERIADVDARITDLMAERMELGRMIGEIKAESNSPVRVIDAENRVIERYRKMAAEKGLDPDNAETVCRIFMQESIENQAALPRAGGSPMGISIVGGSGKMGAWFAELLTGAGHTVRIIDPSSGNGLVLEDAEDSDAVIVSVPISAAEGVLKALDGICREDALIFDITSLKSPLVESLREMGSRRKVCSVHPMFGPSAKSMFARNLVFCDCGSDTAVEEAMALLDNHGADMVRIPVEEHDRYMSYVLGLSHAVNIAFFTVLERSGIPYQEMRKVASTTFSKLMDTNESVALEDPDLYYEIQHLNAYREEIMDAFDGSVEDVVSSALSDDPEGFRELMDKGRKYFSE